MTFVPKVCTKAYLLLPEKSDSLVSLSVVIKVENAIRFTINGLRKQAQNGVICDQRKNIFKSLDSQSRKTGFLSIIFKP